MRWPSLGCKGWMGKVPTGLPLRWSESSPVDGVGVRQSMKVWRMGLEPRWQ